ncbi:hypothetical protein [Streptomyces sp. NBC_00443]|uniref:hypothetical protein n=1 Tax=Streptomyces sp. NBC_00443 TaxID=2975743 RepID=UPI002E24DCEB
MTEQAHKIGDTVFDPAQARNGVIRDLGTLLRSDEGKLLSVAMAYLSPVGGGTEWTAELGTLQPPETEQQEA